ncbi:MAG: RNA 2',3'-cyclic phosphodiesterase [Clostridiaceae bacterium]
MRLFLGISFTEEIKQKINEIEEVVKTKIISGSLVPVENHHITIHFLGSIEEERIDKLKEILDEAASKLSPFYLQFDELGIFSKRKGNIIWLGIKVNEELQKCHALLKDLLLANGFNAEAMPYTPHITLIRNARFDREAFKLEQINGLIPKIGHHISVDRLVLFESTRVEGKLCYLEKYDAKL